MSSYGVVAVLKTLLTIAAIITAFWLYTKLVRFVAGRIDFAWRDRTLKEINRSVNVFMILGVFLLFALEALILLRSDYSPVSNTHKIPLLVILIFLLTGFFIVQKIKDIREGQGVGFFEEELERRITKKGLFKFIAVLAGIIFLILTVVDVLTAGGRLALFLVALYPVVVIVVYGLVRMRLSSANILKGSEFEYKHYTFQNREELEGYKTEIRRYAPYIKRAIRNRDFPSLLSILESCLQKDLYVEAAALAKAIDGIDVNGRYARKVQELIDRKCGSDMLKSDDGNTLNEKDQQTIRSLEQKYVHDPSARNTLALAEAYRRININKLALLYYEELVVNFRRTPEAQMAKEAIKNMKRGLIKGN